MTDQEHARAIAEQAATILLRVKSIAAADFPPHECRVQQLEVILKALTRTADTARAEAVIAEGDRICTEVQNRCSLIDFNDTDDGNESACPADHLVGCINAAVERERDTARAQGKREGLEEARRTERMFPIIDGPSFPWALIAPFEHTAQRNHSQSLERLAQRGGLCPSEALAVLKGETWRSHPQKNYPSNAAAVKELIELIAERQALRARATPGDTP